MKRESRFDNVYTHTHDVVVVRTLQKKKIT